MAKVLYWEAGFEGLASHFMVCRSGTRQHLRKRQEYRASGCTPDLPSPNPFFNKTPG